MMILVHCWWMPGGARDVALSLLRTAIKQGYHPQKIYTLFSDTSSIVIDNYTIPIRTPRGSRRNNVFVGSPGNRRDHRVRFFLTPLLILRMSFQILYEKPSVILISSFAVTKNIWLWKKHRWSIYLHSANQYVWSHYKEYRCILTGWKRRLFILGAPLFRFRDRCINTGSQTPRILCMVNSPDTKRRASKLYKRSAITIVVPEIKSCYANRGGSKVYYFADHTLSLDTTLSPCCHPSIPLSWYGSYFVVLGRISRVIRHQDKILYHCQSRGIPLVIIGDGPDYQKTVAAANETTRCLGRCGHDVILPILIHAKGLINLAHESFGLNMLEALMVGTPVLARNCGNAPYMIDYMSGVLIPDLHDDSLEKGINRFLSIRFYPEEIRSRAKARYALYKTTSTIQL